MESKFCTNCGSIIEEGITFCEKCGTSTVKEQETVQPQKSARQQEYQQPNYQQTNYQYQGYKQQYGVNNNDSPLTVGQYIGTILLGSIPFAGFILFIVWAFSSDVNINKRNLCRAYLILMLVAVAIYILLIILLVGVFSSYSYSKY